MRGRKLYAEEFCQVAVTLVREQGMSRRQVATDLGIDLDTLRRWLDDTTQVAPSTSTPAPAAAELACLRRGMNSCGWSGIC